MDRLPIVDLTPQWIDTKDELMATVEAVLSGGKYILGEHVTLLEEEVSAYTGAKFAVGVANGTDGLILALHAFGIGFGDEVITTPFTFFATAEAIVRLGATPVFVDVEQHSFNLNPEEVEKRITPRTRAIMPVHLFGQMANLPVLRQIADKHGLLLIEDACQAIGATQNGQGVGTIGDAAVLSFFPTKNLGGCGDGGMVLVRDAEIANRLKRLRLHGSVRKYIHEETGWNSRLDELQAAILRVKLKHLEGWTRHRIALANRYNEAFKNLGIGLPVASPDTRHVYHLYTVVTKERDALKEALANAGIASGVYYPVPLHLQKSLSALGCKEGDYPVTEYLAKHALSLPLYPGMQEQDQDAVMNAVRAFLTTEER
jgi:dTDP-4-amino-4,6-dideoxygalactose transaminase